MHFTSGGHAKKNGFRFEIKYGGYLDGIHQDNPWYLYISYLNPKDGSLEGTYTERSVRFATERDAQAFCERIADGEITLSELREREQTAWNQREEQLQANAKAEFSAYLAQLHKLGVEPTVVPDIFHLVTGLSDRARDLAFDREMLADTQIPEQQLSDRLAAQSFGDWFSLYGRNIDLRLVDKDGVDHYLPAICFLEPEDIRSGAYDYTPREKWLLSLPLSHIAENEGCPVAVLKTAMSYEQTEFLLGIPQFDNQEWAEISMRAVYAGADFEARLKYLQEGTPFEIPFNGSCMDALDPDKGIELYQLLAEHSDVYVAAFPGSDDDYYAYAIERAHNGRIITSELEVPIRYTEPGKGLTSTLAGKIAWAQHTGNQPSADAIDQCHNQPVGKEK